MKLSVIITIYNIEKYLERCLKSVIRLDDRIREIICIDDGSIDNSCKIVEKYQLYDSRIKLIKKKNGGISSARNRGIIEASSDYIMFIDGDDYVLSDELTKFLDEICAFRDIEAVWTGYIRKDWNGIHSINTRFATGVYNNEFINKEFIPSILGISYEKLYSWFRGEKLLNQDQEFASVWRGVYSKRIIDKYNIYFNEKVRTSEDVLFNWEYYMQVKKIYISNQNYYCHVWRDGSLTQESNKNFFKAKEKFIKERDFLNQKLKEKGLMDCAKEYQGSLVLIKIQMALSFSKCNVKEYLNFYKMYKNYSSYIGIRYAYSQLSLKNVPLKYWLVFWAPKKNLDTILFGACFILNRLNLHIYPDE